MSSESGSNFFLILIKLYAKGIHILHTPPLASETAKNPYITNYFRSLHVASSYGVSILLCLALSVTYEICHKHNSTTRVVSNTYTTTDL